MAEEKIAATGCVADAEARNGVTVEAAVFEIGAGSLALERSFELLNEPGLRFAMDFDEHGALLIFAAFFGRTLLGTRKRDAAFFGDDAYGLGKRTFFHFHYEFEDVAALAAAEAVIYLLSRVDIEGRSFFGMKRTEATKILASFF
jgi:hypothetical protein